MISGISDRATISRLFADGRTERSRDLRIRYLDTEASAQAQVAFSISRKVGNAVVRNRTRRRLRSALIEILGERATHIEAAMIIVYPSAVDRRYSELRDQLVEIMEKIEKSRVGG